MRIYEKTRTKERIEEWLLAEDPLEQIKAKYEQKFKQKEVKYRKAIQKLLKNQKPKRRCSNCLHSGHNKLTCKKQKAEERFHKMYK